jgi:hypothetical protein
MAIVANTLKENSFEIQMPNTPILASVVTSVDIAGTTLNETELPYTQLDVNVPGEKLTYGKLDLMFLMDENMDAYMEAYNTMVATAGPTSLEEKRKQYFQDVTIAVLNNSKSAAVRYITFVDCWFTFLGNISFDHAGVGGMNSSATLSFSYFIVSDTVSDTTGFNFIANYETNTTPADPFV